MESIDAKLDLALGAPGAEIGDEGFTEAVMGRLPPRRLSHTAARRCTLAAAAAAGSGLTALLGAPVEATFNAFVAGGGVELKVVAALLVTSVLAVPAAWVFYSK